MSSTALTGTKRKRVNADCTLTLSRRVDELVTAIGAECEARQTDEISDEWQGSLEHFRTYANLTLNAHFMTDAKSTGCCRRLWT